MVDSPGPTPRHELGALLRQYRGTRTQRDVAAAVGVTASTWCKWENGTKRVKKIHVLAISRHFNLTKKESAVLEGLAEQSAAPGWWLEYGPPEWFREYLDFEASATAVDAFGGFLVPGLAQCPEYVAVMSTTEHAAQLRLKRQQRLTEENPLVYRAILDESVLHRTVGDESVRCAQIKHLIQLAELPSVSIRVLPHTVYVPGAAGSFNILRFADPALDTAYTEISGGAVYFEKPDDVGRCVKTFQRLWTAALGEKETVDFLGNWGEEVFANGTTATDLDEKHLVGR